MIDEMAVLTDKIGLSIEDALVDLQSVDKDVGQLDKGSNQTPSKSSIQVGENRQSKKK